MAIGKIEPSGCAVFNGKVRVRFSFYLEPDDSRYEEHHVQVPVVPEEGYPGELDEHGNPVDVDEFNRWLESLPKEWQTNPFHNHFIYVEPNISDAELIKLLSGYLKEFLSMWSGGKDISDALKFRGRLITGDTSEPNMQKCQTKVEDIINRASIFEVGSY